MKYDSLRLALFIVSTYGHRLIYNCFQRCIVATVTRGGNHFQLNIAAVFYQLSADVISDVIHALTT